MLGVEPDPDVLEDVSGAGWAPAGERLAKERQSGPQIASAEPF